MAASVDTRRIPIDTGYYLISLPASNSSRSNSRCNRIANSARFIIMSKLANFFSCHWKATSTPKTTELEFCSFAIGFMQLLFTVAPCYWFLALLWFFNTQCFLSFGRRVFVRQQLYIILFKRIYRLPPVTDIMKIQKKVF